MVLCKQDFAKKFQLTIKYLCPSNENHIKKGIEQKGYHLIKCNWAGRNTSFEIEEVIDKNFSNEIWKIIPFAPQYQVSTHGRVKNNQGKFLTGTDDKGYRRVNLIIGPDKEQAYSIHRLVKMVFDPIENDNILMVDHINGIRSDNRLENLRWVFQTDNNKFFDENNTQIKEIIPALIQKFGYQETCNKLLKILNDT